MRAPERVINSRRRVIFVSYLRWCFLRGWLRPSAACRSPRLSAAGTRALYTSGHSTHSRSVGHSAVARRTLCLRETLGAFESKNFLAHSARLLLRRCGCGESSEATGRSGGGGADQRDILQSVGDTAARCRRRTSSESQVLQVAELLGYLLY